MASLLNIFECKWKRQVPSRRATVSRWCPHTLSLDLYPLYLLIACQILCPWNSPGKNTRVGSQSLLQGIVPSQGLNLGLLHFRQILDGLSHLLNIFLLPTWLCWVLGGPTGSVNCVCELRVSACGVSVLWARIELRAPELSVQSATGPPGKSLLLLFQLRVFGGNLHDSICDGKFNLQTWVEFMGFISLHCHSVYFL